MENVYVILFYKFANIEDPEAFVATEREFCTQEGLLGKILVAKEGINGSLSGAKDSIDAYKRHLNSIPGFDDVAFKDEISSFHPFKKLIIRKKKEIIRMEQGLDMSKTGKYISPEELLDMYSSGKDFLIIDTRNKYESDVGKFKNAVTLDIDSFREFPEAIGEFEDLKDRTIVTYCTGGIRCEKATAYMVSRGFTDVYQLKDGIINFCQKHPDTVWEGKCFVFDQRLISDVESGGDCIAECVRCGGASDRYQNCANVPCDDLVILCEGCSETFRGTCSDECLEEYETNLLKKSRDRQGRKSRSA
ncbi:MAG: rhodanese-related sulfurtransferase [Candidatus Dadabacteria bacterium]|nr:rhodanese-related sulfurtransferase [Candidatus Dadabacteria bacterium]